MFDYYSRWYAPYYDVNVTTSRNVYYKFKEFGYKSIVIPTFLSKSDNIKFQKQYKNNIVFAGLIKGKYHRKEYIEFLKNNFDNLLLYGPDTLNGFIAKDKLEEIYASSAISLNFTGVSVDFFNSRKYSDLSRKKQMKGKPFEIIRCGGFLLTESTEDLKHFFIKGTHFDVS